MNTVLQPPFQSETPPAFYGQDKQDVGTTRLENMDFFPALSLLDFQSRYRVDASQHPERQMQCLQSSMITVNRELMDPNAMPEGVSWACQWVRKGYDTLASIPAPQYGTCSEKVFLYSSAVYALAKSLLIQRYPEVFFGQKNRTDKQDPDINTASDYYNEHRDTMHQLMGTPRMTATVI